LRKHPWFCRSDLANIDTSVEKLGEGVRRITGGYGADMVIDGIGAEVFSEALATLAPGGSLTTLA
jgi:NADPH2:quinone reductase